MTGRPRWRSTRVLVGALIASLIAIIWGEVAKDAVEHSEEYFEAQAAIEANKTIDHLLMAGKHLAFERGRTNVILRLPAPASDEHRIFMAEGRRTADDNLAAALERLKMRPPHLLAPLRDRSLRIRQLRDQIDQAVTQRRDDRPADLPNQWLAEMSGMLSDLTELMAAPSLWPSSFSPEFRGYSRVKMLAFDLRRTLGLETSRIAASINAPAPIDATEAAAIIHLRGEGAAIWRALQREVKRTGDAVLMQSLSRMEATYFRDFRPLQESVFTARLAGHQSPQGFDDYARVAVPALKSIAEVMDAAIHRTEIAAESHLAHARTSMLVYAGLAVFALVLGIATMAAMSVRLFGPLRLIQSQLRTLANGNTDVELPLDRRADEMGEMQAAVAMFRDSLVERQRISDELAHQGERLLTLINAMPDFVCFKDGEGRWLVVNDYGRTLFGLDTVDYLGKTDLELSEMVLGCRQTLCGRIETDERTWKKRIPTRAEEVVTRGDGASFIFDVVKVPLFHHDGGRKGLVVVGRDITERRRIEAALARLSRQNELILEAAGDGIIGMDADGNTIFVNPAATRMTGMDMADLLGRSHHALVHHTRADGSPHPAEECPVALTLADGRQRTISDDLFWRKDGTCFPVEFTADAILEQGTVRGAVIVFRDIGERKRSAAEIEALLADLKRSNGDLEQFAYAVSHDLQEPLRMVASYVQMLQRRYSGKLDDDADEFIGYAVDGAKRMSAMINALLEYARVGTRGTEPQPLDLSLVVNQALANLSTAIDESGASVDVVQSLPRVLGDEPQLISLIQNLVGNAIKYRRPDTPPAIRISTRSQGDFWVVSVDDNGVGIPPADRQRVFGVFLRLGARPDVSGTGMGLAICKRIVERLGGSIWIEDSEDGGSRFSFTLRAG